MNVREENKAVRRKRKMTTATDVIRYVIEDIDFEIKIMDSLLEYAERKHLENVKKKRSAMAKGMDYITACEHFDYSIGYHAGVAAEYASKLDELKTKRKVYERLEAIYTAEEEENE